MPERHPWLLPQVDMGAATGGLGAAPSRLCAAICGLGAAPSRLASATCRLAAPASCRLAAAPGARACAAADLLDVSSRRCGRCRSGGDQSILNGIHTSLLAGVKWSAAIMMLLLLRVLASWCVCVAQTKQTLVHRSSRDKML
jgi:hypothetical protein